MENIYTVERLAEYLGLSDKTIREMAASGELKGYKKNGRWFFLHSDIVQYIKTADQSTDKKAK